MGNIFKPPQTGEDIFKTSKTEEDILVKCYDNESKLPLRNFLDRKMPTQDSRDSKIVIKTLREICKMDDISFNVISGYKENNPFNVTCYYKEKHEHIYMNGFHTHIMFTGQRGHYCGYIWIDERFKNIDYFNPYNESDHTRKDIFKYLPHGGFTSGWGFDCAHIDDHSALSCILNSSTETFKTRAYVINELKILTEEVLKYFIMIRDKDNPSDYVKTITLDLHNYDIKMIKDRKERRDILINVMKCDIFDINICSVINDYINKN
jgi:hypothetical protein